MPEFEVALTLHVRAEDEFGAHSKASDMVTGFEDRGEPEQPFLVTVGLSDEFEDRLRADIGRGLPRTYAVKAKRPVLDE